MSGEGDENFERVFLPEFLIPDQNFSSDLFYFHRRDSYRRFFFSNEFLILKEPKVESNIIWSGKRDKFEI